MLCVNPRFNIISYYYYLQNSMGMYGGMGPGGPMGPMYGGGGGGGGGGGRGGPYQQHQQGPYHQMVSLKFAVIYLVSYAIFFTLPS